MEYSYPFVKCTVANLFATYFRTYFIEKQLGMTQLLKECCSANAALIYMYRQNTYFPNND